MDDVYKSWLREHLDHENARDFILYGWYPDDGKKRFYTTLAGPKNLELSLKEKQKGYTSLSLSPIDPDIHLVVEKSLHADSKNSGYVFLLFNKIYLEHQFESILSKNSPGLSAIIIFDGNQTGFVHEVYRDVISFGHATIQISYEPSVPWSFSGESNRMGIMLSIIGFCFFVIFYRHIHVMRRQYEISDSQTKKAEEKLAEHENLYESILENLPGILFIKDVRNNFAYSMFNKQAGIFFEVDPATITGKSDSDFFPEEESTFFRSIDEAVMNGRKVIDIPCETVTVNGKEKFVHTRKVPIYSTNGEPLFLVGLSQDITTRKRMDIELAQYRENLENMVEERTEKLKIATLAAQESSQLKSEFLATMSHEIRSPMSGVLGMAELLMDTSLTVEQKNLTRTIMSSGEVLMNIIEDILDFSKIEANKLELDYAPINLVDLVDDVCTLYSSKAREKALELAARYVPGTEQFVYADPVRLRQVLGNLINNAIKFTKSGFVTITVHQEYEENEGEETIRMVFSIEDTGIGIHKKDFERIFEKFSQANSSTTRDYGGTGLGLSISRRLVELMGGSIGVESIEGKGSIFKFILPLKRNRDEVYVQPKPPALKGRRILIVDDLPIIRMVLCEQLMLAGLVCDTAENGHEALSKLAAAKENGALYDMMLIDYLMPGMNGEMLARAINDEPDFRDICLIMLTAAGSSIFGAHSSGKGFSAYIAKPVQAQAMIESLAYIWEKYDSGFRQELIRIDAKNIGNRQGQSDDISLKGSRILLVEDSRLNQAFVQEVLSQIGCDITIVSNGQEAIDIVEQQKFDLVLMDCQMPVMDGFEATRRLCSMKHEGRISNNMPILALTANAMKGDRQRCMEAGMDDYITKPVRKNELKQKIYFWIKQEKVQLGDDESPQEAKADGDNCLLDQRILNEAKAILKDKFDVLLDCYLEDVQNYIKEMEEAVQRKSIVDVVRPAHTIKSTSKRMGALRLSAIARTMEETARMPENEKDSQAALEQTALLMKEITAVLQQTEMLFRQGQKDQRQSAQ